MTVLRNVLAALLLAAFGIYVLRAFPTVWGLGIGSVSVLSALCIAFPTQIHDGALSLKGTLALIIPVIVDVLPGGSRKTDPPKDDPHA
jgi:hypothetical protein